MDKRSKRPTHVEGGRPKLSEQEGLEILKAELEREAAASFGHGSGRLSLPDRMYVRQIEREGLWRVYLRELSDQRGRKRDLAAALRRADERLQSDVDGGLAAAIEALNALIFSAGLVLERSSAALEQLVDALYDVQANITNPMMPVNGAGGIRPGHARAQFEGEFAGLLEILSELLGSKAAAYTGSDDAAVKVREAAQTLAEHCGWRWTEATPETVHRKIIGDWREPTGAAVPPGRGRKRRPRVVDRLKGASSFFGDELGQHKLERMTALHLIIDADQLKKRGEDLRAWSIKFARVHWALDRRSPAPRT